MSIEDALIEARATIEKLRRKLRKARREIALLSEGLVRPEPVRFRLVKESRFYKKCRANRARNAKTCEDCPFREWIEREEDAK